MKQLEEILLSSGSKKMIEVAVQYIGSDEARVAYLINLFEGKTNLLAMRAAWVASWLYAQYPLVENYGERLFHIFQSTTHTSIRRSIGRVFAFSEIIPKAILVPLIDTAFSFLTDKKQPIAVRVYCIQILKNVGKKIPELKEELKQTLLILANDETSAAVKSKLALRREL